MITYQVEVKEGNPHSFASEKWLLEGKKHREGDLPAVIENGTKYYYKHGLRHRTNGPAIEYFNGGGEWYLDGTRYMTEEQHARAMNPTKELTIAEIEEKLGHKVKIIKER